MLKPGDRRVLLEALRPPQGYRVDRAIAATYSLDLLALLVAPLSFSLFDRLAGRSTGPDGDEDPIGATALLQAVRVHAEQLAVFCQAGAIARPTRYRQLLTYLEGSVVEVRAPGGGVFHPKVWVQRFSGDGPVLYRVLVGSRNLTFDRSWDTLLVLEGELRDRTNAIAINHPLGDFVEALPDMAIRPVSPGQKKDVSRIAGELRRVQFEPPVGFDEIRFWPLGLEGKPGSPFEGQRIDRVLVVSPFVAADTLKGLSAAGSGHVLVSRAEELAKLPPSSVESFDEVLALDEGAEPESDDTLSADTAARGLHAKLYVADQGRRASVWTGSANATYAAFHNNVEMLVQLGGKKGDVGVDAVLGQDGGAVSLRTLLVPFAPAEGPQQQDLIGELLEKRLYRLKIDIACRPWRAKVTRDAGDRETFAVLLESRGSPTPLDAGITIRCWPIALSPDHAADLAISPQVTSALFAGCSFQALTSFFAFRIRAEEQGTAQEAVFIVNAPLEGAPADRRARVLLAMLDDPAKVMRFLKLLLALDAVAGLDDLLGFTDDGPEVAAAARWGRGAETPLLEALLRALDQDPRRLEELDRTVRELRAAPGGAELLPPDLDAIWAPIRAVWETRRAEGERR